MKNKSLVSFKRLLTCASGSAGQSGDAHVKVWTKRAWVLGFIKTHEHILFTTAQFLNQRKRLHNIVLTEGREKQLFRKCYIWITRVLSHLNDFDSHEGRVGHSGDTYGGAQPKGAWALGFIKKCEHMLFLTAKSNLSLSVRFYRIEQKCGQICIF